MGLLVDSSKQSEVVGGNKDRMTCKGVCPNTLLSTNSSIFSMDLHVISFHGANIVLGMAWMENLDIASFDYKKNTINFSFDAGPTTLIDITPYVHEIFPPYLHKELKSNEISTMFFVSVKHLSLDSNVAASSVHLVSQIILNDYSCCVHGLTWSLTLVCHEPSYRAAPKCGSGQG